MYQLASETVGPALSHCSTLPGLSLVVDATLESLDDIAVIRLAPHGVRVE